MPAAAQFYNVCACTFSTLWMFSLESVSSVLLTILLFIIEASLPHFLVCIPYEVPSYTESAEPGTPSGCGRNDVAWLLRKSHVKFYQVPPYSPDILFMGHCFSESRCHASNGGRPHAGTSSWQLLLNSQPTVSINCQPFEWVILEFQPSKDLRWLQPNKHLTVNA